MPCDWLISLLGSNRHYFWITLLAVTDSIYTPTKGPAPTGVCVDAISLARGTNHRRVVSAYRVQGGNTDCALKRNRKDVLKTSRISFLCSHIA